MISHFVSFFTLFFSRCVKFINQRPAGPCFWGQDLGAVQAYVITSPIHETFARKPLLFLFPSISSLRNCFGEVHSVWSLWSGRFVSGWSVWFRWRLQNNCRAQANFGGEHFVEVSHVFFPRVSWLNCRPRWFKNSIFLPFWDVSYHVQHFKIFLLEAHVYLECRGSRE